MPSIDFETFANLASASGCKLGTLDALPYGGAAPVDHRDPRERARWAVIEAAKDDMVFTEDEMLYAILESAWVVALDADGQIRGGWTHEAWFLGSAQVGRNDVPRWLRA